MDPRLLQYYGQELSYIRELGGEFAREFPKIAGRLGLETFECSDPYVERLLEGFAFLAARVHLKLDDEFPRFTQHLLEILYPHYLAPIPVDGDHAAQSQLERERPRPGIPCAARVVAAQRARPWRSDGLRIPDGARRDALAAGDSACGVHRATWATSASSTSAGARGPSCGSRCGRRRASRSPSSLSTS